MLRPEMVKLWTGTVGRYLPNLSHAQIRVLAEYSFGAATLMNIGQNKIATLLGATFGEKPNTVRQRLREFTYEAQAKRGDKRQSVEVSEQFSTLLRWIIMEGAWQQGEGGSDDGEVGPAPDEPLIIALDPTYLGQRFTILAISVMYRGSAIPVAWHVQSGYEAGSWHTIWLNLLDQLQAVIDELVAQGWTILALTDRGLYSKRLFNALVERGYHPMMRIRTQGFYRLLHETDDTDWRDLDEVATPDMQPLNQRVTCFKDNTLEATLTVQWDGFYDEPCMVLTDLPPTEADQQFFFYRSWIEVGFKDLKRGGLHWEHTKMRDPQRVQRLWLVLATSMIYLLMTDMLPSVESLDEMVFGRPVHPQNIDDTAEDDPISPLQKSTHSLNLSVLSERWIEMLAHLIRLSEVAFSRFANPCQTIDMGQAKAPP